MVSVSAVCLTVIGPCPAAAATTAAAAAAGAPPARHAARLGSSVQVPEKSGFWAKATVATARTAAAMIPIRARFMRVLLLK